MLELSDVMLVICIFLLSAYTLMLFKNIRKRYPPGPWGFPLVGHIPLMGTHPQYKFQIWRRKYGDVFCIRMGSWRTVVINGYTVIKEAMVRKGNTFSDRPEFLSARMFKKTYEGHDSLAFGSFSQSNRELRKLSMRALHRFTNTESTHTQAIVHEEVEILLDEILSWNGKPHFIEDSIRVSVGSILYQLLYGREKNLRDDDAFKYVIALSNELNDCFSPKKNPLDTMPWLKVFMPGKASKLINVMSQAVGAVATQVLNHSKTFDNTNVKDILGVFHAADVPKGFDLVAMNELMGAGQDTTTVTLCWLITYLLLYPQVQTRIQNEIDEVVGSGRKVSLKDRPKLCYTEATIVEAFRIRSAAQLSVPRYTTEDTKLGGFDIDKGTVVIVNIHSANMDESYWTNPEIFRPERLLNNNDELDLTKCSRVIAFGLGPRRCLGEHLAKLNIFLILSNLLQRCTFTRVDTEPIDLTPIQLLTAKPKPVKFVVLER